RSQESSMQEAEGGQMKSSIPSYS
ncbi:hypothetical protein A2U01_0105810, partial [Trifolium medium]|nr:hypothetical protein [Trifolium medium]